jgi:hypothetical protein
MKSCRTIIFGKYANSSSSYANFAHLGQNARVSSIFIPYLRKSASRATIKENCTRSWTHGGGCGSLYSSPIIWFGEFENE